MTETFNAIKKRIDALTVFSNLKNDPAVAILRKLLTGSVSIDKYCTLVSRLYKEGGCLTQYVARAVCDDENFYLIGKSGGRAIPEVVEQSVAFELSTLDLLSQLTSDELISLCGLPDFLPKWTVDTSVSVSQRYGDMIAHINERGYGMFSRYCAFVLQDKTLTPVKSFNPVELDKLSGYDRQRQLVIDNTKALLEGKPCNNVLLYGDAGTGKSTTVKAVASYFMDRGLRLIELKKNQLYHIPYLLELLNKNPLKFIIFIDDLSFTQNDDNFAALKATLEGGLHSTGRNVAVYATSNRRHLIKENFSDRDGDDIHVNDTLEELHSLSERFGLTVSYQRPDKDVYLSIVSALAYQYGVDIDEQELFMKAERFALRSGGRSPRVARQFIELTMAGI